MKLYALRSMQKVLVKIVSTVWLILLMGMIPVQKIFAQDLTLPSIVPSGGLSADNKTYILIGIRLVLVLTAVIAGILGFISGFHWINAEGNAIKGHDNKMRLAYCLLIIVAVFFLLVLYKTFIPDYTILEI